MSDPKKYHLLLFDYFSFTVRGMRVDDVCDKILGMGFVDWEAKRSGAHGYRSGVYYKSVSVFYDAPRADMGVWVDMTGSGCRTFESYSVFSWQQLFAAVAAAGGHITRLDVAYDERNRDGLSGVLDLCRIDRDLSYHNFTSRARWFSSEWSENADVGVKGRTIYIGSPSSNIRIRMYDKAVERGLVDSNGSVTEHWVRVELQLRDELAAGYIAKWDKRPGDVFAGVLRNYLRFLVPGTDSNKARWDTVGYWEDFLCGASAISIYSNPGREYNAARCANFVFDHAGNAVQACIDMFGEDGFFDRLANRRCAENPKYQEIIDDYRYEQAQIRAAHDDLLMRRAVERSRFNLAADADAYDELLSRRPLKDVIDRQEKSDADLAALLAAKDPEPVKPLETAEQLKISISNPSQLYKI